MREYKSKGEGTCEETEREGRSGSPEMKTQFNADGGLRH